MMDFLCPRPSLKMVTLPLMMVIIAKYKAEQCPRTWNYQIVSSDNPSLPQEEIISSHNVEPTVQVNCNFLCYQEPKCVGFNFRTKTNDKYVANCQLTNTTKRRKIIGKGSWTLFHDVDAARDEHKTKETPSGKSCLDIKKNTTSAGSGVHWIKPYSNSSHFKVYCDMETHGGGWTLVYSYTFTNYTNFRSGSNAVTPRPNWPAPTADVPISTTPPLSETSRGAVDYSLWKYIGNDILIKSNINDWIVCQPNGGSLVTKKYGSMSCQNIKHVAPKCHKPPSTIYWIVPGPTFDKYRYFFDGDTGLGWYPRHDFCHSGRDHKKGVSNPGGTIYIR